MVKASKVSMIALVSAAVLTFASGALAFGGRTESRCSATVPDKIISGDFWYGPDNWNWCRDSWLETLAFGSYQMEEEDWDNGFGWDDACNTNLPFARLATARVALEVSSANPRMSGTLGSIDFGSDPILDWALLFTVAVIDDLRASCGVGSDAIAFWQPNLFGSYIVLNVQAEGDSAKGFFYGLDVPGRAATLIHEARHWDGGPDHINDDTQDRRFNDGGSYSWETIWLWWYAHAASNAPPGLPSTDPEGLRCRAMDQANALLMSAFAENPGFLIDLPFCI